MTHQPPLNKSKKGLFGKPVLLDEVQAANTTHWRLQGSPTKPSISKETYFSFSDNVPLFPSITQNCLRMSPLTFASENNTSIQRGINDNTCHSSCTYVDQQALVVCPPPWSQDKFQLQPPVNSFCFGLTYKKTSF